MDLEGISQLIDQRLAATGMTRAELARRASVSTELLRQIDERSYPNMPRRSTLTKIALALGLSADAFTAGASPDPIEIAEGVRITDPATVMAWSQLDDDGRALAESLIADVVQRIRDARR